MESFWLVAAFTAPTLFAITVLYIGIMGPSRYHRHGVVGWLYRGMVDLPRACLRCCSCGGSSDWGDRYKKSCCGRFCHYLMNERHWGLVIFYIALVWSVEIVYLLVVTTQLEALFLSKMISCGLVISSEVVYFAAVFSDPGTVTTREGQDEQRRAFVTGTGGKPKMKKSRQTIREEKRKSRNQKFPFSLHEEEALSRRYVVDGILYGKGSTRGCGVQCVTCNVPRPSRSKHCRMCNRCVRRYDHHCPWINNDVAEANHRWFLLFLLLHIIECIWGLWDLYTIVVQFLEAKGLWFSVIRFPNGYTYHITFLHRVLAIVTGIPVVLFLFVFTVPITVVLVVFWLQQMSLVISNVTINDMNKIDATVDFVINLPTVREVYEQAKDVCCVLEKVASKPPRMLKRLTVPSEEETVVGSKRDEAYRKKVANMLTSDLRGLFDRGMWNNLKEVMFPYG